RGRYTYVFQCFLKLHTSRRRGMYISCHNSDAGNCLYFDQKQGPRNHFPSSISKGGYYTVCKSLALHIPLRVPNGRLVDANGLQRRDKLVVLIRRKAPLRRSVIDYGWVDRKSTR